jgi:hypothetical protein
MHSVDHRLQLRVGSRLGISASRKWARHIGWSPSVHSMTTRGRGTRRIAGRNQWARTCPGKSDQWREQCSYLPRSARMMAATTAATGNERITGATCFSAGHRVDQRTTRRRPGTPARTQARQPPVHPARPTPASPAAPERPGTVEWPGCPAGFTVRRLLRGWVPLEVSSRGSDRHVRGRAGDQAAASAETWSI